MQKAKTIFIILAVSSLISCARTQTEKDLDAQVAAQPARSLHGEVAAKGMDIIKNSPSLSKKQKEQFLELHKQMMASTFKIQDEISKLKVVLFESIAASPYNAEKVEEIKKRLVALNDKKMANMFEALKNVQTIMGYMPPEERRAIMQEFIARHHDAL